jgi:hypothetical protein
MTVYLPDKPGDCPMGINSSVDFSALIEKAPIIRKQIMPIMVKCLDMLVSSL